MDLTTLAHLAQVAPTGCLVALIALAVWAFYTGRIHSHNEFSKLEQENTELKNALDTERQINSEMIRTGSVTNQLIEALTEVAIERGKPKTKAGQHAEHAGLTAEDLGL